ncbi:glycosyltransferase [Enterobacter hormaechei]|uniref:ATP-grasp fold amidoligase family protein n=1 Tax=Enterobacter hormaechei TaxID=158836 RepID=UPI00228BF778|nr:glycosyltransferase [Enterobacter hormaechei]MCU2733728.1 glycosyltransferase [Enterobacter hormaechei subsp. steigerwaltii]HCT9255920.1 glycosyltransferase [Enterobacter hormaechei]
MKGFIKKITPNIIHLIYRYYYHHKRIPNLLRPKLFNEKVALRMLKPKKIYSVMADKIAVREYVKERIGEKYLIPMLWTSENLTRVDWDSLPNSFVLKANHASGTNLIVHSKNTHNFDSVQQLTNSWLSTDFSKINFEKHYKHIKPMLLAEQLLKSEDGRIPFDYKVHCFNSVNDTKFFIQVDYDRFESEGTAHSRDFFDHEWNFVPFTLDYKNSTCPASRPNNLDKLLSLSKKLSEGLAYARIDWYIINDEPLFGEITLTHGCAGEKFTPEKYNKMWGELWDDIYEKHHSKKLHSKKG